MEPKVLKTEREYEAALTRIDELIDAEPDSPEEDELALWGLVVQAYEAEHYPIDPPSPVEAIRFRMEQQGLTRQDLEPLLGGRNRVSEVLNSKRGLSVAMIWRLHDALGIPLESLLARPTAKRDEPKGVKSHEQEGPIRLG